MSAQDKAIEIIRKMTHSAMFPLPSGLKPSNKVTVQTASNASAWTTREAFVQLFMYQDPSFDANKFREACCVRESHTG